MDSTRIASTPLLGLRPLGSAADRSYERICDLLRTRVSADVAALLAEPVISSDGRRIDWYVQGSVDGKPLTQVSAAERGSALAQVQSLRGKVQDVASRLEASAGASDRNLASVLVNAVNVPGDDFIYLVNGDPVLVAWGFIREDVVETSAVLGMRMPSKPSAQGQGAVLSATQQAPASEPSVAPVASVAAAPSLFARWRPRWLPILLWSLFAALLALLIWLLLTVCYFSIPFVGLVRNPLAIVCGSGSVGSAPAIAPPSSSGTRSGPPSTSVPRTPDADRGARLLEELRDLERQLQEKLGLCEAAEQAPKPDMQRRLDSANARSGEIQISLTWEGNADLDLYVLCGGGVVGPAKRNGCGGELDIDMNAMVQNDPDRFDSLSPVENIIWTSAPPRGEYKIAVELYYRRSDQRSQIPFKLRIRRGSQEENITGTVSELREKKIIKTFTE